MQEGPFAEDTAGEQELQLTEFESPKQGVNFFVMDRCLLSLLT